MPDFLEHYGMPRRSGRYPWGSGKDPYQRTMSFMSAYNELRKQGLSQTQIAAGMGITTSQLRSRISLANAEIRRVEERRATQLRDKGYSVSAIGREMGKNESSVRNLLDPAMQERARIARATTDMLQASVDKFKYVDIGLGSEGAIGVSRQRLLNSIKELQEEGYKLHKIRVEQQGNPGHYTTQIVLGTPESEYREVVKDKTLIQPITGRTEDFGRTYRSAQGLGPVQSVASDRVGVRYYEEGGNAKDGVIELRRGVADLDLGNSKYAQVRIGVDGSHYIKGMAMYSDDMPQGKDIIFNTNKHEGTPMLGSSDNTVLKTMKVDKGTGEIDKDNPFGATIKREGQRGALNVVTEEGDWGEWSKTLSSQMLSKQPPALAKQQLDMSRAIAQDELNEIKSLTLPAVKTKLLNTFADSCDSSARHLEAAGLPRQRWHVILPVTSMKDTEVYAPNYDNGDTVVLIRYPHGGKFEIPQLTVNNNQREAKAIMGGALDAVGIHPNVAKKLSGADFDGDTVLVIPNKSGAIKVQKSLSEFDPIEAYRAPTRVALKEGSKPEDYAVGGKYNPFHREAQMGSVSNLITDMTIKGAPLDEVGRAIRHSMVVIDAEKHDLDFKQSYHDNGIAALKETYQGGANRGASTIISKSGGQLTIPEVTEGARIGPPNKKTGEPTKIYVDPQTGEKLYTTTGASYEKMKKVEVPEGYIDPKTGKTAYVRYEPTGQIIEKTTRTTPMDFTPEGQIRRDAHELSSGTPIERIYATHANGLKAMANDARKEALSVQSTSYSPSAKKTYASEVASMNEKVKAYEANKPRERQAQILTESHVLLKKQANPGLSKEEIKKIRNQTLTEQRDRMGRKKYEITITPSEWKAIQSGAFADNTVKKILDGANLDVVKQYATPRTQSGTTPNKEAKIKGMAARGYTQAQIAEALGISTSTVAEVIR